jgi:hypothetical protein
MISPSPLGNDPGSGEGPFLFRRSLQCEGVRFMSVDATRFTQLCERLAEIDLFGTDEPAPPWGRQPALPKVRKAIDAGTPQMPLAYQTAYIDPLVAQLETVLARAGGDVEPFAAPIYEQAPSSTIRPPLQRFLAVISDLYLSFLSKAKRSAIDVPLVEQLPPLAFFKNSGAEGPFTIPADDIEALFGSDVGVVSLPSTYRNDPLLWASLAHETGGHDVVHADPDLLTELAAGVRALFASGPLTPALLSGTPSDSQLDALIWSYWIDEATADVYGLLNIGPAFALNLAAFFAAINARFGTGTIPTLGTSSGPRDRDDPAMDEHPTDILRLHLAIGVVESLAGLATETRNGYVADLQSLATLCAPGAKQVSLQGNVPIDQDHALRVKMSRPLADMQEAARRVGAFIATARLKALRGHTIQEIETWDDPDQTVALRIAAAYTSDSPTADMGDDAQLLAGATLSLLANPEAYVAVTQNLNEALDRSFARDPLWMAPARDPMIASARLPVPAAAPVNARPRPQPASRAKKRPRAKSR